MLKNNVLYDVAEPVIQGQDDINQILHEMTESLTPNAVGIAAPQVGISKRIILCKIKGEWVVMINPSYTPRGTEKKTSHEGCLSFPGVNVKKQRFYRIEVKYLDEDFKEQTLKLSALASYIVQHEVNHLNGITICP